MVSRFQKLCTRIFFCLLALLLSVKPALAVERRTAFALKHYIMALICDGLGDAESAIQEYKKALKADYTSSVIHLNLAASYIKNNNLAKAIEELNLVTSFDPEAVEPHAILALLYWAQDKPKIAEKEYETALENAAKLQPTNIDIYKSLGIVYTQQKRFPEAKNTYRLILDLSPQDPEAHFYLGNIYYELKNKDAAVKELKKALELKPDYHEALNYLGYLFLEENQNLDQAEAMIRKALELDPNNGAYIDSLGWFYFKKGKLKEAAKILEKASTLLEDPVIFEHLGDSYLKIGEKEKAKTAWEKSLKLDPAQEEVKKKLGKIGN